MKQIIKLFVFLLVLTAALAGCGSGGWGGPAEETSTPIPTISPITKTVAFTASTAGSGAIPFADTTAAHTMLLYTPQEMKGAGIITAISFKYNDDSATAVSCPSTTIKMSHTNRSALHGVFAENINTGQGSQQTVLNNATVNIPIGTAGTYYTIPLTTPFNYNGEESLVVEVTRDACNGTLNTVNHDPPSSLTIYALDNTSTSASELAMWLPDTKFNINGGDSAVNSGSGGNSFPFGNTRKIQLLYTAAEINGSGIITGIGFPVYDSPTPGSSATVTVTLGHTSLTNLTATYADNFNSATSVVVANAKTFTVPAGIPFGGYVWIPIPDGTFTYNGTDNLVVQIETPSITGSTRWMTSSGTNYTRVYGNPGDLTGTPDYAAYLIKFRFAGAPVHFITGGSESDSYPFALSGSGSIRQMLYRSAELGAKGTITKVAHRLADDAVAGTYDTLTVKLANTDLTTLGTSFSTNLPSSTTVYTGTYSIPATLKAGDWIEIPLTTPFAYDPAKNLLVEISNHSGNAGNINRGSVNGIRYPGRRAYAADYTTDTAGTSDFLADFRLIVE